MIWNDMFLYLPNTIFSNSIDHSKKVNQYLISPLIAIAPHVLNVAKGSRFKKKRNYLLDLTEHTIAMYNLLVLRYLCCTSLI